MWQKFIQFDYNLFKLMKNNYGILHHKTLHKPIENSFGYERTKRYYGMFSKNFHRYEKFIKCSPFLSYDYSTRNSNIQFVTNKEYEKFNTKESLRKLNLRNITSDDASLLLNQEVKLTGWIEVYPNHDKIYFCDGYGKILCAVENNEIKNRITFLKHNEMVSVEGVINPTNDANKFKIILSGISHIKNDSVENEINVNSYCSRTHTCGQLRLSNIGERVTICGWLQYQRMGKFLLLRDSYGITQCVMADNKELESIPLESTLLVNGTVCARPTDMINPDMDTGDVEVLIENYKVLNLVENIPFTLRKHQKPKEQLRLQYRYVDLRYAEMQNNLRLRSQILHNMRKFLVESHLFIEVETPTLFCRTPGGAREFVVPTHHPGLFYSLVQSPQQFKQMLMVGGIDRYFQIARCYRDEATRPDRQPEFTQLDIEVSFTTVEGILKLIEDLIYATFPLPITKPPFRKLSYQQAIETYGSDKPDLSYDLKLNNISTCIDNIESLDDFGAYAIVLPHKLKLPKRVKDTIKDLKKRYLKAHTIDHTKLSKSSQSKISSKLGIKDTDLFVAAGSNNDVCLYLGEVRSVIAEEYKSQGVLEQKQSPCEPLWIVDFPLFVKGENGELETCHHPFTAPHPEDLHLLETEPLKVRSLAYDLVMNGNEVGGGSIRVHNPNLQIKLLEMLNIDVKSMEHFIKALRSGCPPHGGIALGIDRMMSLACNSNSIRDVIAFPKSHEGKDPLSGAPHCISKTDMDYYHLDIKNNDDKLKTVQ